MALRTRLSLLALALGITAGAAALAVSRDGSARAAEFLCPDGERLSIDQHADHLRVRNGSGVFILLSDGRGGFAGDHWRLSPASDELRLEPAGNGEARLCARVRHET